MAGRQALDFLAGGVGHVVRFERWQADDQVENLTTHRADVGQTAFCAALSEATYQPHEQWNEWQRDNRDGNRWEVQPCDCDQCHRGSQRCGHQCGEEFRHVDGHTIEPDRKQCAPVRGVDSARIAQSQGSQCPAAQVCGHACTRRLAETHERVGAGHPNEYSGRGYQRE